MSNFIEEHEKAKLLASLTEMWKKEKEKEDEHRFERLALETKILDLSGINQSLSGTKVLPNSVRVSCKLNRTWDQELIKKHYTQYCLDMPESERPFTMVYKENKKNMDMMQLTHPEVYKKFLIGLTEKAAKPAFKLHKS